MTAGPKYGYRWADGVQIKKPIEEVSAPKYMEYLMDWIEGQLDDESIFPQKLGTPFPPNFKEVVKTIFKRLFRVYMPTSTTLISRRLLALKMRPISIPVSSTSFCLQMSLA
jgi:MOB kinase activator 1